MPLPRIVEPAFPLWALPAAALALGSWLSVLPGSPFLARATAAAALGDARCALLACAAGDAALAASVLVFVRLSEFYGRARHPEGGVRPYLGPWRREASSVRDGGLSSSRTTRTRTRKSKNDDDDGESASSSVVVPPRLFAPFYLLLALSCACLAPAAGLAHALLTTPGGVFSSSSSFFSSAGASASASAASASVALLPYLFLFAWQWLLEMRLCRRSLMAPAIPLAFSLARPWQLARAAALVEYLAEAAAATAGAAATTAAGGSGDALVAPLPLPSPSWLPLALRLLSLFWIFDTAALLVWLPWTYNWQTQA